MQQASLFGFQTDASKLMLKVVYIYLYSMGLNINTNARVDWLAMMDDDDITKKFPILLEGILQDVFSQRPASAWQGAQPQKLTVSMLLPGTSSAAEWRDLLQSRRQFWPTPTTRHASLVPVSAEALQRERRQMQAKHLWYNVDIRWSDLKDKLEVLAPTGLTRDDIWRHLFLTKQRKNPYEEGCCTGEDLEDVKQKWEAKKEYFSQYKKDGFRPPCIDLDTALQGFDIDNTAAYQAIEDSKALHARRWQTKEGMYRIKRKLGWRLCYGISAWLKPLLLKHGCARLKLAATHVVVCGLVWPPSLSHVVV